jgi:hypothetical protein
MLNTFIFTESSGLRLHLDLDDGIESLLLLLELVESLSAENTSAPLSSRLVVLLVEVSLDGGDEGGKSSLVLGLDLGDGNDGSGLLVDKSTESGLTLDNSVRDTHLSAEGREEDNELDGVDIVGNEDEVGLLVLNQRDNMVETVLHNVGLLGDVLLVLAGGDSLGLLGESLLLLLLSLGSVLVEELEGLGSGVLVQGVGELSERRRNLESHAQNLLLSLESNVLGPLDESGEVSLRLDGLTNAVRLGLLLKERVLSILGLGDLGSRGGGSNLLSFSGGLCH